MSTDKKAKIVAMKKVIANMTLGNDMSAMFPEVLGQMQTTSLELKKMVYLYVITYAKLKPELALMCVNSFIRVRSSPYAPPPRAPRPTAHALHMVPLARDTATDAYDPRRGPYDRLGNAGRGHQDAGDINPLIRGLAIRTMGYIHVDKITEALTEPLRKCLKACPPLRCAARGARSLD